MTDDAVPAKLAIVRENLEKLERIPQIAAAVAAVATRSGLPLAAVYLFGSFARGNAGPQSDIDLGLLYIEPPGGGLLEQPFLLEAELGEALGRSVQCVVMNLAPVDLVHRILRDQQLLLDREPSLRCASKWRPAITTSI